MPFKQRLKGKIGTRVIVVMDDGVAFRGFIRSVEEGIVIMDRIEETVAKEVEWETTETGECGFHSWCAVDLPKVYLNPIHISRVWTLPVEESLEEKKPKKGKEYLYAREPLQVI